MARYRWDNLSTLVKQFDAKRGIEIGVQRGYNMVNLLKRHRDLYMIGIDGWDLLDPVVGSDFDKDEHKNHYLLTLETTERFGDRATIIKALSEDAAQDHYGDIDFVFIDADHSYEGAKRDIELWALKVKKGGFISGHDYESIKFPGVTDAVNEIFGEVNTMSCTNEQSKVWWVEV